MKMIMKTLDNKKFSAAFTLCLFASLVLFFVHANTVFALESQEPAVVAESNEPAIAECVVVEENEETEIAMPHTDDFDTFVETVDEATEIVEETVVEEVVEIAEETFVVNEVPKYDQMKYDCPYGNVYLQSTGKKATVQNSGCGITCLAMVATYLKDDPSLTPDVLAAQFGRYNTDVGSDWALFTEAAEELGLGEVKMVFDWNIDNVEDALRNGSVVISNQRGGVFTMGGHYIVLTGMTEDGRVMVNDPYGPNSVKHDLKDGFENGFKVSDVASTSFAYWIYEPRA